MLAALACAVLHVIAWDGECAFTRASWNGFSRGTAGLTSSCHLLTSLSARASAGHPCASPLRLRGGARVSKGGGEATYEQKRQLPVKSITKALPRAISDLPGRPAPAATRRYTPGQGRYAGGDNGGSAVDRGNRRGGGRRTERESDEKDQVPSHDEYELDSAVVADSAVEEGQGPQEPSDPLLDDTSSAEFSDSGEEEAGAGGRKGGRGAGRKEEVDDFVDTGDEEEEESEADMDDFLIKEGEDTTELRCRAQ